MKKKQLIVCSLVTAVAVSVSACKGSEKAQDSSRESESIGYTYAAEEETLPESSGMGTIELIDYKSSPIELKETPVTEEALDAYMEDLRMQAAEETGKPAEDGDLVTISYSGSISGVPVEGENISGFAFTCGDTENVQAEFAGAVKGDKAGETKTATITYPDQFWNEALKGNTVLYEITVDSIQRIPELDDAFAAAHSKTGQQTLTGYREECRAELEKQERDRAVYAEAYWLLQKMMEESEFQFEESFLEQLGTAHDNDFNTWLAQNGMSKEEYLKEHQLTEENLKEQKERDVMDNAKYLLIARKIQETEELNADMEAIKDYWNIAYGSEITDEEINEYFPGQQLEEMKLMAALINYLTGMIEERV